MRKIYVSLDVFKKEPLIKKSPLWNMSNVTNMHSMFENSQLAFHQVFYLIDANEGWYDRKEDLYSCTDSAMGSQYYRLLGKEKGRLINENGLTVCNPYNMWTLNRDAALTIGLATQ